MQYDLNTPASDCAGTIIAVNISASGIPKRNVEQAEVTADGLVGDGQSHEKHRRPHRAVTVADVEVLDQLAADG